MPAADHQVDAPAAPTRPGTAITAMSMRSRRATLPQLADVVDRHAAARLVADLLVARVSNSATISKPSWRKPG